MLYLLKKENVFSKKIMKMEGTSLKENRLYRRIPLHNPLAYRIRGNPISYCTLTDDISRGGVAFYNQNFIAPNTTLNLEIEILKHKVFPIAKVRWSAPLAHSNRYRVGAQFIEINDTDIKFLEEFINTKV